MLVGKFCTTHVILGNIAVGGFHLSSGIAVHQLSHIKALLCVAFCAKQHHHFCVGNGRIMTVHQTHAITGWPDHGDTLFLRKWKNTVVFQQGHCLKRRFIRLTIGHSSIHNCVDLIILNETEGAFFTRTEVLTAADISRLRSCFPGSDVILTLGAEGSVYEGTFGTCSVPAYPAEAVDTTGAGDTYTGYLIAELARGVSIRAAMETASKAAALAVSRPGAASSIPRLCELSP